MAVIARRAKTETVKAKVEHQGAQDKSRKRSTYDNTEKVGTKTLAENC